MLLDAAESQLLLVDYQPRLMAAMPDAPGVLAQAEKLARAARLFGVPCWATEQNPAGLGGLVPDLKALTARTLPKMDFSAAGVLAELLRPARREAGGNARSLPKHLQKAQPATVERPSLVLAGCETHVCVLQTALDLAEQEWDVWVVTDACASRRERDRDAAFDRLAGAGCELVSCEMVIFEWLRSAEHPMFKEALALVK